MFHYVLNIKMVKQRHKDTFRNIFKKAACIKKDKEEDSNKSISLTLAETNQQPSEAPDFPLKKENIDAQKKAEMWYHQQTKF